MSTTPSFKDMPIWQRSLRLAIEIYQLTTGLPATERLGLSSSLQQAAVTIPSLLAAGTKRGRAGFHAACLDARASCAEVETLLYIVQQTYPSMPVDDLINEVDDIQNGLTAMAHRPGSKQPKAV